jgi:hypothetical protein
MRCIILPFLLLASLSAPHAVQADDLVAVNPGVMCTSAGALAHLTLPDGRSKSGVENPLPRDMMVAQRGGCISIPYGARISVYRSYRNTSVGIYDPADGRGPREFIIPNINFRPLPGSGRWTQAGSSVRLMAPAPRPFTSGFFFSALEAACPRKPWRGTAARLLYAPLAQVLSTLPPAEREQLAAETTRRCLGRDNVSCGADVAIPFLLTARRLDDLVQSYCAADPG